MIKRILFTALIVLLTALSACGPSATAEPAATFTPAESATPSLTPSPQPPTPTPEPMAAQVNGEGITLAEYQAELQRLQAGGSTASPEEQKQLVLDSLIDQTLLAQAAYQEGFTLDDAALEAHIESLAAQIGGMDALRAWQNENFYTDAGLRIALRRSMAAAWKRDLLIAATPTSAEQVHARQLLFNDEADARAVHNQLAATNGASFEDQLDYYDPLTKGELGWFPRGFLLQAAVEDAAFNLQPGQFSEIIKTEIGYHIVQVIEREDSRPLSPDALRLYQSNAIRDWLAAQRAQSQISILVP